MTPLRLSIAPLLDVVGRVGFEPTKTVKTVILLSCNIAVIAYTRLLFYNAFDHLAISRNIGARSRTRTYDTRLPQCIIIKVAVYIFGKIYCLIFYVALPTELSVHIKVGRAGFEPTTSELPAQCKIAV